jgi:uncharacterized protein (DUF1330 family)
MGAYVISEISDIRPEHLVEYLNLARPSIASYGGRYLASSATIDILEGSDIPKRIVIVEFDDMDRARTWYRSPEYARALAVRERALERRLMLVDGKVD